MLKVDWNIVINMINIFVLYLLMKKFLFGPITEMMEKRTNAVKASLAEAENNKNEAEKLKQDYEACLKNADAQAVTIINEAKQRALEERAKQIKAAKEEAAKIIEDAKKTIELEKKLSMQDIQSEIAGIALLAASKVIKQNVNDSTNQQMINDFLAEAGAGR
ncbi:MAG: synthase, subunit b [Herbinix sp.]|jgi:F-type H+-transporting ATPase subunit b|nr:synthase, subunit b [Herbinix sp.]